MNISSLNTYNYTSFTAKKTARNKTGKYRKQENHTAAKAAGAIGLSAAALAAMVNINSAKNTKTNDYMTTPSISYIETIETVPFEETIAETIAPKVNYPSAKTVITTLPQEQRKAKYHEVVKGDRLADIVKKYAELDELTPDEELTPYYELLEADNPGKWSDRNKINVGIRFRVDSILPENVNVSVVTNILQNDEIEETEPILVTEPVQETSIEDTISIHGNVFSFDLGTMNKTFLGDYEGLMFGKFVVLDKKMNGNIEMTKYEGTTSKTNISQELTYDKDGKIIEISDYEDNKVSTVSTYTYKMDSTIETVVDKNAKSKQIDEITTVFDNGSDAIKSREFKTDGKTVAKFDFDNATVEIGNKALVLDNYSFVCNDDAIGAKKYTALIGSKEVHFDVLKNGFCIEYLNNNGEIYAREQFDAQGNLIYTE